MDRKALRELLEEMKADREEIFTTEDQALKNDYKRVWYDKYSRYCIESLNLLVEIQEMTQ